MASRNDAGRRHARYYVMIAAWAARGGGLPSGDTADIRVRFDSDRAQLAEAWRWLIAHSGNRAADELITIAALATGKVNLTGKDPAPIYLERVAAGLEASRRISWEAAETRLLADLAEAYQEFGDPLRAVENARHAIVLADSRGDAASGRDAMLALGGGLADLGDLPGAAAAIAQVLDSARTSGDRRTEAEALASLGMTYARIGDLNASLQCDRQAVAIALEIGDQALAVPILLNMAIGAVDYGDLPQARDAVQRAAQIAHDAGALTQREGRIALTTAYVALACGEIERAQAHALHALSWSQAFGDLQMAQSALGTLGDVAMGRGDSEGASARYREQLRIAREAGAGLHESRALGGLAHVAVQAGDLQQAAACLYAQLALARRNKSAADQAISLCNLASLHHRLGSHMRAESLARQALAHAREVGARRVEADVMRVLSTIAIARGDPAEARFAAESAYAIMRTLQDPIARAQSAHQLARVMSMIGDYQGAIPYYAQALGQMAPSHRPAAEAEVLRDLGNAYVAVGDFLRAQECHERAISLAHAQGDLELCRSLGAFGLTLRARGRVQPALNSYRRQFRLAVSLHDRREICAALINSGVIFAQYRHRIPRAARCFRRAQAIAAQAGCRDTWAQATWNLALIAELQGRIPQARDLAAGLLASQAIIAPRQIAETQAKVEQLDRDFAAPGSRWGIRRRKAEAAIWIGLDLLIRLASAMLPQARTASAERRSSP